MKLGSWSITKTEVVGTLVALERPDAYPIVNIGGREYSVAGVGSYHSHIGDPVVVVYHAFRINDRPVYSLTWAQAPSATARQERS